MDTVKTEYPSLMLVEDPRNTIITLCNLKGSIVNWDSFKKKYEETINRTHQPVAKGNADCHFYSLTQMEFFIELENNKTNYIISGFANKICSLLKSNNISEYKRHLRNHLLNNEKKGRLFREFTKYIKNNRYVHKIEISKVFKPETTRSIIAWSLESDLIEYDEDEEILWLYKIDEKKELSTDSFWRQVLNTYLQLEESNIFGISRIFVNISQLRYVISSENNWSLDDFDTNFITLLDSNYGRKIRLYGGPSSTFEGKRNFLYKNKL